LLTGMAATAAAGLRRALEARGDILKAAECANYFAARGYVTT